MEERKLLLSSLNTLYDPYEVPVEEMLEIWQYHSFISRELPEAGNMLEVKTMFKEIKIQLNDLKSGE